MSLLMDALKKAEQEKREAAKRLEEAREKGLAADADAEPAQPDPDITAEREIIITSPPAPAAPVELSLEPRASITGPMERPTRSAESQSMETAAPADTTRVEPTLVSSATPESKPKTPLEFIEEIGPEGMASFDQTFHGVALASGQVPGLFDETLPGSAADAGSRTYDQTLPGVPAAQLARDIGGPDQPTPAAAQTVFTAGHQRRPDRLYKWGLGGLGLLVLVAVFIFVYNVQTPVAPNTPSPWVARGIEAVPPPSEPVLPPVAAVPGMAAEPASAAPSTESTGTVAAGEPAPAPAAPPEVAPPATTPEPVAAEQPAVAAPVAAEPPPAVEKTPAAVAEGPAAPPSPIRISRKNATSEHDRMVREAYSYYQAADFDSAAIHYLAVLNDRPDTLDALLGMGAIALKQGDPRRAVEYFSRVLKLDPKNQTATAALIGLQRSPDPGASESALKFLLQESPDSPFLYFVLGNIYASQSRWSEAQQAFFDAYRNDSANPDYAMNLAASLDRLGQAQPALDYYSVALKLAESQPAGFDAARVRARIDTLSSAAGQTQ